MTPTILRELLDAVASDPYFAAVTDAVDATGERITGPAGVRPFVTALVAAPIGRCCW